MCFRNREPVHKISYPADTASDISLRNRQTKHFLLSHLSEVILCITFVVYIPSCSVCSASCGMYYLSEVIICSK